MGNIYKSLEVFLNPKYLSAMTQIPKLLKHNNLNTMQIKREEKLLTYSVLVTYGHSFH